MSLFLVDAGREWRDSQRQVLCIARELRKKGWAAHLVLEPGGALHRKAAEEGLSTLPLRMHGRMKWVVRQGLTRAMRAHGCRLAHFHETLGAALELPAAASAQVPVRILSRPADSSPLEGRLPLAAVDAVIAGSEGVRSILVRGGVAEGNVEVVPPGLDFSPFTLRGLVQVRHPHHSHRHFVSHNGQWAQDGAHVGIAVGVHFATQRAAEIALKREITQSKIWLGTFA